jgi:hypothetical protein
MLNLPRLTLVSWWAILPFTQEGVKAVTVAMGAKAATEEVAAMGASLQNVLLVQIVLAAMGAKAGTEEMAATGVKVVTAAMAPPLQLPTPLLLKAVVFLLLPMRLKEELEVMGAMEVKGASAVMLAGEPNQALQGATVILVSQAPMVIQVALAISWSLETKDVRTVY